MTEKERNFFASCESFKNYANSDEYIADIRRWLMLSDWHYTEEQADELINKPERMTWIKESFAKHEAVADIAIDVGYCCG
jgi:hypothetical protein